mmetsp:Transcript_51113/g.128290  ORF Transcript_51113/g.128290 Transcript_51113/m.128290 type:complete len:554 (-) Transcript_51113:661-2322(-)
MRLVVHSSVVVRVVVAHVAAADHQLPGPLATTATLPCLILEIHMEYFVDDEFDECEEDLLGLDLGAAEGQLLLAPLLALALEGVLRPLLELPAAALLVLGAGLLGGRPRRIEKHVDVALPHVGNDATQVQVDDAAPVLLGPLARLPHALLHDLGGSLDGLGHVPLLVDVVGGVVADGLDELAVLLLDHHAIHDLPKVLKVLPLLLLGRLLLPARLGLAAAQHLALLIGLFTLLVLVLVIILATNDRRRRRPPPAAAVPPAVLRAFLVVVGDEALDVVVELHLLVVRPLHVQAVVERLGVEAPHGGLQRDALPDPTRTLSVVLGVVDGLAHVRVEMDVAIEAAEVVTVRGQAAVPVTQVQEVLKSIVIIALRVVPSVPVLIIIRIVGGIVGAPLGLPPPAGGTGLILCLGDRRRLVRGVGGVVVLVVVILEIVEGVIEGVMELLANANANATATTHTRPALPCAVWPTAQHPAAHRGQEVAHRCVGCCTGVDGGGCGRDRPCGDGVREGRQARCSRRPQQRVHPRLAVGSVVDLILRVPIWTIQILGGAVQTRQ